MRRVGRLPQIKFLQAEAMANAFAPTFNPPVMLMVQRISSTLCYLQVSRKSRNAVMVRTSSRFSALLTHTADTVTPSFT